MINKNNLEFIERAVKHYSQQLNIQDNNKVVWVAYGSYVINAQKEGSDLDLMCIGDEFKSPKKHVLDFEGVPVHLFVLPTSTYCDDGEKRLYGAYFTGKLLNPHILLHGNKELNELVQAQAGAFIGDFAGFIASTTKKETHSKEQLTAQTFLAFLEIFPSFDSYFLKYYASDHFEEIWSTLCDQITESLKNAKIISQTGTYLRRFDDQKTFHEECMNSAARHWSFGTIHHANDYLFHDKICANGRKNIDALDPTGKKYKQMLSFLNEKAGITTMNRPYRQGVHAFIIDEDNNFLIVQKNSYKDNEWTFIGGGREEGETVEENVFREIEEETGIPKDQFEFIKNSNHRIEYDWHSDLANKLHEGKYRGQSYNQVLIRFKGDKHKMKFNEEIRTHKWVKASELKNHLIFPDQYKNVEIAIKDMMPELLK